MAALKQPPPVLSPASKPAITVSSVVRRSFSDARRRALQTQGRVTMLQVRANQSTMKFVP
ncbi:MAG: hypothetical protein ACKVY0_17475 [Prosthecobacter sp.]|uniref:hypothetical protein n=1 Tax=Prosthecobacter sp. TaxID=1965333 RepID=UPI003901E1DD